MDPHVVVFFLSCFASDYNIFISFNQHCWELAAQPDVMLEIANPASFIHCCCDISPMKTMRFHFSTPPPLSHLIISSPLSCFSLSWTEAYLWCESQHGWQRSIWWHEPMNTLSLSLSVRYRCVVEMNITVGDADQKEAKLCFPYKDQK